MLVVVDACRLCVDYLCMTMGDLLSFAVNNQQLASRFPLPAHSFPLIVLHPRPIIDVQSSA